MVVNKEMSGKRRELLSRSSGYGKRDGKVRNDVC